jgi:hypothetical protein
MYVYTQSQNIERKNNLKCFGSNETKDSKQRSQIRLLLSMPEREP